MNYRYFFADVVEVIDEKSLKIRLDDGRELYARPALGHWQAMDEDEIRRRQTSAKFWQAASLVEML